MNELNAMADREIQKVRLRLLDLVKSFFLEEPDAEKMSRWRGTFAALSRERVNGRFDRAVDEIVGLLQNSTLESLQEEYNKLFVDPFTDKGLQLSASYYLSGRNHGKTLVDIRSLLMDAGIERRGGVTETEDSLVVMIDIYARLIEAGPGDGEKSASGLEEAFLGGFLLPFAENLARAAEDNEFARFYEACCRFFRGYLEMERELAGVAA